jgi:hypothetical protein
MSDKIEAKLLTSFEFLRHPDNPALGLLHLRTEREDVSGAGHRKSPALRQKASAKMTNSMVARMPSTLVNTRIDDVGLL